MAIGDAVASMLGTATTNYQPTSGVEVQISVVVKDSQSDSIDIYDGTNNVNMLAAGVETDLAQGNAASSWAQMYNTSIMLTNTVYLRKQGTTERMYIGGVQTNS